MMTKWRAAGIVMGSIEWKDPREYLEAALWITVHLEGFELVPSAIFLTCRKISDYACDHGEERAVMLIREMQDELAREGIVKP